MTNQKSRKEYIGVPVGLRLSEAPLPKTESLEACMWKLSGECQKSMPDLYKRCKGTCFAYIPAEKKQEGDYQI